MCWPTVCEHTEPKVIFIIMTLTRLTFISLISICLLSCNWHSKNKQANENSIAQKDTTHLVNLLKSYEPNSFKGNVVEEFYKNRGAYDWWRFPLVFPYSIGCIDVTEYGTIYSDRDRKNYDEGGSRQPLTNYFDKFIFDKNYFVGTKFRDPFSRDTLKYFEQYIIFSFANGTSKEISGKESLYKKLKEIKFSGDTTFMTIKDYGKRL